jgi:tetratricopeptide (TPR) repeat protein
MNDTHTMPDAAAEALMGEIIDDFLERLGNGDPPDVEEYVQRYPLLADVLRDMLPALQVIQLSPSDQPQAAGYSSPEIEPERPLGDFRIVREIGRGGMGVVYEAVQISLGRRVALKVLSFAAALDSKQLQRFKNEAQAAAHLHHRNIVPIYAVGCDRGVHYYAMQLIEGATLGELIQGLRWLTGREAPGDGGPPVSVSKGVRALASGYWAPAKGQAAHVPGVCSSLLVQSLPESIATEKATVVTEASRQAAAQATAPSARNPVFFRTAASLALQAAEALEHAHSLGIVHRDIKPANLLVDTEGNLWITDFGLARLQCQPGLTASGDLVGTLRYMSPEQALGRTADVDHRADIYALGATLYELVCLRPVFSGHHRQELLRQIAHDEPRPPRRLNSAVPAELEVIIQKALEKEPGARYATIQDLADDLRRFLEDRPVRARRPSWLQRVRKWARRHRPVVWTAAVGLLVALVLLAGSVGWIMRDRAARQARTARQIQAAVDEARRFQRAAMWPAARAAAKQAVALLASAEGAEELRQMVRELQADLWMVTRVEEIRTLRSTVKDGRFDDEGADRRYAAAFRDYGIDVEVLAPQNAAKRLRARAIRAELAAALDDWSQMRRWFPQNDGKTWQELLALGRAVDADPRRSAVRDAVLHDQHQALVELGATADISALPPGTLVLLAQCLWDTCGRDDAATLLRRAQELHPGDFWINQQLAYCLVKLRTPQWDEAIRFYTASVALRPESPGARLNLGNALAARGRRAEALAAFRRAIELMPDYAEAHCNLGMLLWDMGKRDAGIAALRKAIELKPRLAIAHAGLGVVLAARCRFDEAIQAFRKSIALKLDPDDLALTYSNLGHALVDSGHPEEALTILGKAMHLKDSADVHDGLGKIYSKLGRPHVAVAAYRRAIALEPGHAKAHCNLGIVLGQMGQDDEAIAAYRRAIALTPDLITAHFNLGVHLSDRGQLDEAIAAFHKVLALEPEYPMAYYDLARAFAMKGRIEDAAAAYRKAIALKPDYAEAHCNLGWCLRQSGEFAQALVATRLGHELGSRHCSWPYPSDRWVHECERLEQLAARLAGFPQGVTQAAGAAEKNELAQVCYGKQLYVGAARLWADAFAADPKLAGDRQTGRRYDAARAAGLAGSGQGKDAGIISAKERARWRRQALAWLRAELALRARQLDSGKPVDRADVQQKLRIWQQDPKLIGVREAAAVARLPSEEQQACTQLWAEVEALLAKAEVGTAAARTQEVEE